MGTYTVEQLYAKIQELNTQKEALRQALIAKGATVESNLTIDNYPTIISNLCS